MGNTIKKNLTRAAMKAALSWLDSNPKKSIPKLTGLVEKLDRTKIFSPQIKAVREGFKDKDNNWHKLYESLLTDIDGETRKKVFENLIINATVMGCVRQNALKEENNCNIPWAILLDPVTACNLNCKGCWAAEYEKHYRLPIELWDSIIYQGKAHGTFVYLYSGGEPLLRKDDIIRICEEHSDCIFGAFTNATLIDEAFADDILRVKNFIPIISIEGFREETDFRRGEGSYKTSLAAIDILKQKRLLFGVSCCYTRKNTEVIGSEEFFNDIIARGAKFAWFFTYMPIGADAGTELMVTPEQREFMYRQIRSFRSSKPLFTLDFWNDAEFVEGCIAGGRLYLHINANGDVEPCAFIHYSDSNIRDKTLLEAYKSPLFMQYHDHQPFNENHLRPCPLLDNPEFLSGMVELSGAKSTELRNPEDAAVLCEKCKNAAVNWAAVADRIWAERDKN